MKVSDLMSQDTKNRAKSKGKYLAKILRQTNEKQEVGSFLSFIKKNDKSCPNHDK